MVAAKQTYLFVVTSDGTWWVEKLGIRYHSLDEFVKPVETDCYFRDTTVIEKGTHFGFRGTVITHCKEVAAAAIAKAKKMSNVYTLPGGLNA